ncbi:MAG: DnaA regulatory inactivator Hda [Burkholderiales bacterium]
MAEQLVFELAPAEPPSFSNFVPGRNAEAVARLVASARGETADRSILLWGAEGAGRSHLLRAAVAASTRPARYVAGPAELEAGPIHGPALIAVDDVDRADADAQGRLFTLFNRLQDAGGLLMTAAAMPPGRLALRDDLRTRLGSGLVYEVQPLRDEEKPDALERYARDRGFRLSAEVIAYLLAHGRRDMGTLVATLAALDRHSLAEKRPITVPMLRQWLQRDLPWRGS